MRRSTAAIVRGRLVVILALVTSMAACGGSSLPNPFPGSEASSFERVSARDGWGVALARFRPENTDVWIVSSSRSGEEQITKYYTDELNRLGWTFALAAGPERYTPNLNLHGYKKDDLYVLLLIDSDATVRTAVAQQKVTAVWLSCQPRLKCKMPG